MSWRTVSYTNLDVYKRQDQLPGGQRQRVAIARATTIQPAVVGISALSIQFGAAAKMAEIVKGWRPDCPVVFGGHHATYLPEDSLANGAHYDVVVPVSYTNLDVYKRQH